MAENGRAERRTLIVIVAMAAMLLAFNRTVLSPFPSDAVQMEQRTLAYLGDEGVTVPRPGLDPSTERRAAAALSDAPYFAAYAEGPAGRTGVWIGAHDSELARSYALAACGADCRVLAERRPVHAPDTVDPDTIFLLHAMARRVGERWPYVSNGSVLAIGGAGAWGTGNGGGRMAWRAGVRQAVEECNARRAAEATPEGVVSPPCRYMSLRELEVTDLRPETPLYPAPYEVSLTRLTAVPEDRLRLMRGDGTPLPGVNRFRQPVELYGARAENGDGAGGVIRAGGWPEAAAALAIAMCETERRFGTAPCALATQRLPASDLPEGTLAVTPALMEAYRAWQETEGAGAFAIGALGVWGTSYGFDSIEDARQRAADWCAYYSRRGNRPFSLRRAFIDQPPCRIVAERGN